VRSHDLDRVWSATTTTDRDRKELLHALLEEVIIALDRANYNAHLTLRWRAGLFSEIDVALPRSRPAAIRTTDDTIALLRRLAEHYPDAVIAGILNRQGRKTATGLPFNANRVSSLRTHWNVPCFQPASQPQQGECVTIERAAQTLGVAASTLHRWLNEGFIAGEQVPLAHPTHRGVAGTFCRASAGRLSTDDRCNSDPRRLPPNYLAACKARRARGRSRSLWTSQGLANQDINHGSRSI
jgi:hypothetical protein